MYVFHQVLDILRSDICVLYAVIFVSDQNGISLLCIMCILVELFLSSIVLIVPAMEVVWQDIYSCFCVKNRNNSFQQSQNSNHYMDASLPLHGLFSLNIKVHPFIRCKFYFLRSHVCFWKIRYTHV